MKQIKLTFVLTMLLSMVGLQAFAVWGTSTKVQVNDLYYYLDKDNFQAQVTSMPSGKYTGEIVIPVDIIYEGNKYSVTSIGNSAFSFCSSLTSVTIPNSVTSIGNSAFEYCDALTKVVINDIAVWCRISFGNNSSNPLSYANHLYSNDNQEITNLVIPSSVMSISNYAFQGCSGLTSVTIPNSVTSIGDYAFYKCSGLTSVNIPNSVTSIGDYSFRSCSSLTSVNIPNSVTSIGNNAFRSCSGLTSVIIPNSVTIIGGNAFSGCSSLTSVTIGNSVASIGNYAFNNCDALTKVIVSDIAAWCKISFENNLANPLCCARHLYRNENQEIKYLIIPNGVTNIGNFAFFNCSDLNSVTIPNSVTNIGNNAFSNCSSFSSVTIPNRVTSIGSSAFSFCYGLTSVNIPNSVISIGDKAFYYCSRLKSITIPNSVTSIGDDAFGRCDGLTKVIVSDIASWCRILFKSATANPLSCANYLYGEDNQKITNLVIPSSVTGIGDYSFRSCYSLTSITIPISVTSIGNYSFYWCDNLISVTVLNPTPFAITQNVFSNQTNATLYVPKGSKSAYETADYWKEFKEIVEIDVSGINQIMSSENGMTMIFTIDGKCVDNMKNGLNVIRMSDGTTRKVVVK